MIDIRSELIRLIELNHDELHVSDEEAYLQLFNQFGESLVPGLLGCLRDDNVEVRLMAVVSLGNAAFQKDLAHLQKEQILAGFMQCLADEDRVVRGAVLEALAEFGEDAHASIPAVKRMLADQSDATLRLRAAGTLSQIAPNDPDATPVLLETLDSPMAMDRANACDFLGKRQNKSGVLKAMALLSDPFVSVRFAASVAVGKTFHYWFHAVAVCVSMLKDLDPHTRNAGKECLLSLGIHAKTDIDLLKMALVNTPVEVQHDIQEAVTALQASWTSGFSTPAQTVTL